jgi:hypothetical protein
MVGRYQYELIRTDGETERLYADTYRLGVSHFDFIDFDPSGGKHVKKRIEAGLVDQIHQIEDTTVPGSGE